MATPLNVFKTVTAEVTTEDEIIYTTPIGNTAIVLMAQIANITNSTETLTFSHFDDATNTSTELVKDFEIPGNDSTSVITGKLIVEQGSSLRIQASSNNTFKVTMSILESLNA